MAPPKQSRKGKKAWRKNIDAADAEEHIEQTTHQERRGPKVTSLPDDQLFSIDKTADDGAAAAAVSGRKKKKEKKPLRSQMIIDEAHAAIPVVKNSAPRKRGKLLPPPGATPSAAALAAAAAAAAPPPVAAAREDAWVDGEEGEGRRKRHRAAPLGAIRPVEVDMPGCSINPDHEYHQDAMAELVAAEHKKEMRKELAPKAPSLHAPADYTPQDELARLLEVDVDNGDEDEQEGAPEASTRGGASGEGGEGGAAAGGEGERAAGAVSAGSALDRKTRKDRNKEERRRVHERAAQQKAALKRQRVELSNLGGLQRELQGQQEEREAKRVRRETVKAEKAASQPPRLGKLRYQAEAVQVLTTDEITGSLRQVPACFTVTRDRFKSLQKRGLIEPRKPRPPKVLRKRIEYQTGERAEKAVARQEELQEMRRKRTTAAKKALVPTA